MSVLVVVFGDIPHTRRKLLLCPVLQLGDDGALKDKEHMSARTPVVREITGAVFHEPGADITLLKCPPKSLSALAPVRYGLYLVPVNGLLMYAFDLQNKFLPL